MTSLYPIPQPLILDGVLQSEDQNVIDRARPTLSQIMSAPQFKEPTVMDLLSKDPEFSLFTALVKKSGLEAVYSTPIREINKKITVFAVPNHSWNRAPTHILEALSGLDAFAIIAYNTLPYPQLLADLAGSRKLMRTMHPNYDLLVEGRGNTVRIGERLRADTTAPTLTYSSRLIGYDNLAQNGIIHIVNIPAVPKVLLSL